MSTETPEPSDGIGADAEAAIDARLGAAGAAWRAAQPTAARVDSAMFRPAPARSGWLVAAAAASVVLIAGGVFVATRGAGGPTGSAEPAAADGTTSSSPAEKPAYASTCELVFATQLQSGSPVPAPPMAHPGLSGCAVSEGGTSAGGVGVNGVPPVCATVQIGSGAAPSAIAPTGAPSMATPTDGSTGAAPPTVTVAAEPTFAPTLEPPMATGPGDPAAVITRSCVVVLGDDGGVACVVEMGSGSMAAPDESGLTAYPPIATSGSAPKASGSMAYPPSAEDSPVATAGGESAPPTVIHTIAPQAGEPAATLAPVPGKPWTEVGCPPAEEVPTALDPAAVPPSELTVAPTGGAKGEVPPAPEPPATAPSAAVSSAPPAPTSGS